MVTFPSKGITSCRTSPVIESTKQPTATKRPLCNIQCMSHLFENLKNLEENSPVLGACPGQSGTHKTKLSPGDDGDDGGEEQDTGKTGQQVEEHLGVKFM